MGDPSVQGAAHHKGSSSQSAGGVRAYGQYHRRRLSSDAAAAAAAIAKRRGVGAAEGSHLTDAGISAKDDETMIGSVLQGAVARRVMVAAEATTRSRLGNRSDHQQPSSFLDTSSDQESAQPHTSGSFLSLDESNTPHSSSSSVCHHSDAEDQGEAHRDHDLDSWRSGQSPIHHPYASSSAFASSDRKLHPGSPSSPMSFLSSSPATRKVRGPTMSETDSVAAAATAKRNVRAVELDEVGTDCGTSPPGIAGKKSTRGSRLGQQMGRKGSSSMLGPVLPSPDTASGGLGLDFGIAPAPGTSQSPEESFSTIRKVSDQGPETSSPRGPFEAQRPGEHLLERRRGASDTRTPTLRCVQSDRRPLSFSSKLVRPSETAEGGAANSNAQGKDSSDLSPTTSGPAAQAGRLSRLYYKTPDGASISGRSVLHDRKPSAQNPRSEHVTRRIAFGYRAPSYSAAGNAPSGRNSGDEQNRSVSALGYYEHSSARDSFTMNRHGLPSPKGGPSTARELILPSLSGTKGMMISRRGSGEQTLLGHQKALKSYGSAADLRLASERNTSTPKAHTIDTEGRAVFSSFNRSASAAAVPAIFPSPRGLPVPLTDLQIVQLGAIRDQSPRTLLPSNGSALSSKNVLTIALAKAQSAVTFDSNNDVPEAVEAYGQAVRLLQEVMQRITPKAGASKKSNREDERRRLKVIHDTYTERIRLLAMLEDSDVDAKTEKTETVDDSLDVMPSRSSLVAPPDEMPDLTGRLASQQVLQSQIAAQARSELDNTAAEAPASRQNLSVDLGNLSTRLIGKGSTFQPQTFLTTETEEVLAESAKNSLERGQPQSEAGSSYQSVISRSSSGPFPTSSSSNDGKRQDTWLTGSFSTRPNLSDDLLTTPATPYFDADSTLAGSQYPRSPLIPSDRSIMQDEVPSTSSTNTQRAKPPIEGHHLSSSRPSDTSKVQQGIAAAAAEPRSEPSISVDGQGAKNGDWSVFRPKLLVPGTGEDRRSQSYDSNSSTSSRPRASTLSGPASRAAAKAAVSQTLFVNATTHEGTISQRRRSPSIGGRQSREDRSDPEGSPQALQGFTDSNAAALEADKVALRKRALSQPGSRRPSLVGAASFQAMPSEKVPALPRLNNKRSLPGLAILTMTNAGGLAPPNGDGTHMSSQMRQNFRLPSPALSNSSGYHAMLEYAAQGSPDVLGGQSSDPYWATPYPTPQTAIGEAADLFPSGLASLQALGISSYTSWQVGHCPRLRVAAPSLLQESRDPLPPEPRHASLRPYNTVAAMNASISKGSFVTPRVCIASSLWLASGARLTALETKVRLIEIVITGIDAVEKSGAYLLRPLSGGCQPGLVAVQAAAFAKHLEDFEVLLSEVQNTLGKKLGVGESSSTTGKKAGSSFGVLSSKFTRSIDRLAQQTTSGKNLDSPASYVDSLQRLFSRARVLERHLLGLLQSKSSSVMMTTSALNSSSSPVFVDADTVEAYASLPPEVQRVIEAKLHRASDFFRQVIVRLVVKDLHLMVDKSLKRSSAALVE